MATVETYSAALPPVRAPSPHEGTTLADTYRVGRLLAMGGSSVVHEAQHVRLGHRVAIKFLDRNYRNYEEAYARFRREAEIASSLGHDNIAKVTDFNTAPDGTPYMVMELLDGEDLADRLQRGPLTIAEVVQLSEQLASALGAAHRSCVVHRDLKPENIFLCPADGGFTIKVLDFGISKIRGAMKTLTHDAQVMGTPAYMSPEQARGDRAAINHRADIYALGAVLYEALCGRRAYDGENVYEILTAIATTAPPALPCFPAEVDAVVRRAMARDPKERFETAGELHRALVLALTGEHIRAISTSGDSFAWEDIELEDVLVVPPRRSRARLAIACGVVALVVIATGITSVVVHRDSSSPAASVAQPPAPVAAPVVARPAVAPPEQVTITIAATPPGARLELDGVPVTGPLRLPRDRRAQLRATAPGHRERALEVVADHDRVIEVRLEPVKRATTVRPRPKAKPGLVHGSEL